MGLKIADLLRWRDSVVLKNEEGQELNAEGQPLEEGQEPLTVYLRVIGDDDLGASYRIARIASQEKRRRLEDKESLDWKEATQPIEEATKEQLTALVLQARTSNLAAEARSSVKRPDLPELDEFAVDPDAASLAEQEKYQAAVDKTESDYEAAIEEYIKVRTDVAENELKGKTIKELKEYALNEVGTLLAMGEFYAELYDQKTARACYMDKTYKEKAFDSVEDFKSSAPVIKQQLIDAYAALETRADGAKN